MRVAIFHELRGDTPHSFDVFLADLVRHLEAAGIPSRVVRPPWTVPGQRSEWRHLLVSALLRQVVYPVWASRQMRDGELAFLVSAGLAPALRLWPRRQRAVVFCHDVIGLLPPERSRHRLDFGGAFRRWFLRATQTGAFRRADLIIVPSRCTHDDLIAVSGVAPDRVVVVSHRVDSSLFYPGDRMAARRALGWNIDGRAVMAIVTTERRKNVDGLLDAFTRLVEHLDARLLLIGAVTGPQQLRCRSGILAGRVTQLENLSREALALSYRAADCLAHVSHYEGFGYPLAEALASGCPIVCGTGGAALEVVGDCAEVTDASSPADVAQALERVLSDAARRDDLRRRGLARAVQFTSERPYAALLERVWRA